MFITVAERRFGLATVSPQTMSQWLHAVVETVKQTNDMQLRFNSVIVNHCHYLQIFSK